MERAPITIRFMLACHCSPLDPSSQVGVDCWNSSAGIKTRQWLFHHDLIDAYNGSTPKGKAWVKFICNTPLPVCTWSLPERDRGEVD